MKRPLAILALVAAATALPAAAPEDPVQIGLALRSGYALASQQHLNPYQLGLGITVELPLASGVLLQGELAYFYRAGRQYLADLQPPADPANSADLRKNQLEGLVARLGASWALDETWSLAGGLQVGNARFSQQVIGQTQDTGQTYLDTYNSTPVKSSFSVSPFVGLHWNLDPSNVVELDLLGLTYTSIDFVHTPGAPLVSGDPSRPGSHLVYQGDHLESKSRIAPTVEIAYRFRF